ncbi:MAG: glycosyltransferase 87 family protein [Candidatus Nanopelagicaceae bacterium]
MKKYFLATSLSLLVALISFIKSLPCRSDFFQSPNSYMRLCYSDIPALFGARSLDQGVNPYASATNSMEYPVGTGYIASTIARFSDDFLTFFDLNVLLIALLFTTTTLVIARLAPDYWPLFIAAPALAASLYINWDIWGVFAMVLAFFYIKKERWDLAGIWFGLSIAIKFFPIFFLPIFLIFFLLRRRSGDTRSWRPFTFYLLFTIFILNISTAITYFEGWSRFFTFNQDRGVDLGSIWYALQLLFDLTIPSLNLALLLIGALLLLTTYPKLKEMSKREWDPYQVLTFGSFISLALLFSVNKVYSPQYIIWLTPLAVLSIAHSCTSLERTWFWIWQVGEAIYHLGIWQYLAEFSGGTGLSEELYALTIFIRISTLAGFAYVVAKARLHPPFTEESDDSSREGVPKGAPKGTSA